MTVYVSLPELPLGLRFEEPFDEVVEHIRGLLQNAEVRRYETGEGRAVLVSYGVVSAVTIGEGHRVYEISEQVKAVEASIHQ